MRTERSARGRCHAPPPQTPRLCRGAAALATLLLLARRRRPTRMSGPRSSSRPSAIARLPAEDGTVVLEIPGTAEDAALVPLTVRVPPSGGAEPQIADALHRQEPRSSAWRRCTSGRRPAKAASAASRPACASTISPMCAPCSRPKTARCIWRANSWRRRAAAARCRPRIPDSETVDLGKMIVKTFPPALDSNPIWSAQVMIKHPNSNGMQLDINTANFIPARFVKEDGGEARRRAGVQDGLRRSRSRPTRISASPSGAAPTTISTSPSPTPTRRGSPRNRHRAGRSIIDCHGRACPGHPVDPGRDVNARQAG